MPRACFSEKPITPPNPVGHPLAGYITRTGKSQGVHDDIFARVVIIEDSGRLVVAVSLDLLGVDNQMYSDILRIANQTFGNNILIISATHTHSAPATLFRSPLLTFCEDVFDPDSYSHFLGVIENLFSETNPVQPSSIYLCKSLVQGVATDRNNPMRYQTLPAYSLIFTTTSSEILLFNTGIHPTVLGPENLLISSDFIGYTVERLKSLSVLKGVLFFNGAAGNISTRFTRKSQTFDEARRIGYLLADQIEAKPENCTTLSGDISYKYEEVEAELTNPEEILSTLKSELPATGSNRVRESMHEGLMLLSKLIDCPGYPSRDIARLQLLRMEDTSIVTVPFEVHMNVYEELAEVAEKKGVKNLLLFSYTNGYLGYLSNPEEGVFYERLAQFVSESSFEKIKKSIVDLL
ncbi:neutral/alkaline non-lysosomal ceramidase N-terminal domain-containing protein [Infirmifilum lucidum]|uniref:Neutral/alkaline non-lysosomal ceramidase N-terminal domain-containing protein n=1 Tax=Infirmifilum lucidum TaxID=2776706 RepID=A0A7L9FHP1_9CREN|nr:neutral/alkaline non-lysosomal ceramidase N-terminal domain-containing protein [Infirmifilum lucidum]QOJ79237.1 neutral/alkaline non-lysosomal ceramidase N-terminal domain-containing protein [Infirmifilum lucidum]